MKTYDEWLALVRTGARYFADVPLEMRDYEMSRAAVAADGWALSIVLPQFRDRAVCLQAVTSTGWALRYVPAHLRDYAMCHAAVAADLAVDIQLRASINHIPEDLAGREFLEIMASSHENI
jgi:hypothetical protein